MAAGNIDPHKTLRSYVKSSLAQLADDFSTLERLAPDLADHVSLLCMELADLEASMGWRSADDPILRDAVLRIIYDVAAVHKMADGFSSPPP